MKSFEDIAVSARARNVRDFATAAYAVLQAGESGLGSAAAYAHEINPRAAAMLEKAAVVGGSMLSPGWPMSSAMKAQPRQPGSPLCAMAARCSTTCRPT
jgi:hypothetical protein